MGAPDELNRLRLLQRAYGDAQPTPERRRRMGEAIARFLLARRLRRSGVGAVDAVAPVRRIDPID